MFVRGNIVLGGEIGPNTTDARRVVRLGFLLLGLLLESSGFALRSLMIICHKINSDGIFTSESHTEASQWCSLRSNSSNWIALYSRYMKIIILELYEIKEGLTRQSTVAGLFSVRVEVWIWSNDSVRSTGRCIYKEILFVIKLTKSINCIAMIRMNLFFWNFLIQSQLEFPHSSNSQKYKNLEHFKDYIDLYSITYLDK